MIDGGPVDDGSERGSERENGEGSVSFRSVSTATPVKTAKRKIRKIKKMVSENQQNKANTNTNTNRHRSDEVRLRIQAKIEEQKNAVRLKHQQEQQEQDRQQRESNKSTLPENDTTASSTASTMMALLSDDIGEMELEMQRLLQELESAKEDMPTATKQQKHKQQQKLKQKEAAKKENVDEEFLAGRITELEVENEILLSRLQSGQATVDSIRNDIANMASSNQESRKALRESKERVRPLQLEQESLRSKVQRAEEDLQALETKAAYQRTVRQVETDQKEVFDKAAREIMDLQRNLRLKKQISQRKLQQRVQEKKQKQQLRQKMMQEHVQQKLFQHEPIQTTKSMESAQRTIKRQSSWWQLDASPEKPPSLAQVRSQSFHVGSREVSRDSTLGTSISEDSEIDSSDLDTLSASSDIDFSHRKVE